MGTSAVIHVEDVEYAEVYKHWDGYPEDTLPWLIKFNERFANLCDGSSHKFAQLLRSSVEMQKEFNLDDSTDTGWGVEPYGDCCGYTYVLKKDGSVTVDGTVMTLGDS